MMLPNIDFCGFDNFYQNVQKSFQCEFCNQWNISFTLKSFYQIPLTWSKTYSGATSSTTAVSRATSTPTTTVPTASTPTVSGATPSTRATVSRTSSSTTVPAASTPTTAVPTASTPAATVSGQFGCGILKVVGPKMQDFLPRNQHAQKNFCFQNNPLMNYGSSESTEIVLSKSIFYVKNRRN